MNLHAIFSMKSGNSQTQLKRISSPSARMAVTLHVLSAADSQTSPLNPTWPWRTPVSWVTCKHASCLPSSSQNFPERVSSKRALVIGGAPSLIKLEHLLLLVADSAVRQSAQHGVSAFLKSTNHADIPREGDLSASIENDDAGVSPYLTVLSNHYLAVTSVPLSSSKESGEQNDDVIEDAFNPLSSLQLTCINPKLWNASRISLKVTSPSTSSLKGKTQKQELQKKGTSTAKEGVFLEKRNDWVYESQSRPHSPLFQDSSASSEGEETREEGSEEEEEGEFNFWAENEDEVEQTEKRVEEKKKEKKSSMHDFILSKLQYQKESGNDFFSQSESLFIPVFSSSSLLSSSTHTQQVIDRVRKLSGQKSEEEERSIGDWISLHLSSAAVLSSRGQGWGGRNFVLRTPSFFSAYLLFKLLNDNHNFRIGDGPLTATFPISQAVTSNLAVGIDSSPLLNLEEEFLFKETTSNSVALMHAALLNHLKQKYSSGGEEMKDTPSSTASQQREELRILLKAFDSHFYPFEVFKLNDLSYYPLSVSRDDANKQDAPHPTSSRKSSPSIPDFSSSSSKMTLPFNTLSLLLAKRREMEVSGADHKEQC
eukprot:GDKK01075015.1.p1 GENE.GDKK01075015.1~~GDKK01075015.1.p1  ORF type:complete len:596 (+),score=158.04 GDKK01075015.1:1127-2914(+)